jgi:hypothetical protein
MDVTVGAVLLIVVIAFAVERGSELVLELLARLPGRASPWMSEPRLEIRLVSHLMGFGAGVALTIIFDLDLINLVSRGMVTQADWIVNGLLVAWTSDVAHQIMTRWIIRPSRPAQMSQPSQTSQM